MEKSSQRTNKLIHTHTLSILIEKMIRKKIDDT
mgnify:CR=1 FL=1